MNELKFVGENGKHYVASWTPEGILLSTLIPAAAPQKKAMPKRGRKGNHFAAKLTAVQVHRVRARRKVSTMPTWKFCVQEAETLKVSPATVHHILTGRTWKKVK